MTNQMIKRYQETGTFKGDRLIQTRETMKQVLLARMKDDGFIPLYDVDPVWEQSWVEEDKFEFVYTWQAIWAGKEKAWQIEGSYGGKTIPSSPKSK